MLNEKQNIEKAKKLMSEIFEAYAEYQLLNDTEKGYATYRCVSAARIAEQIMKFKNSRDEGRLPEYQNAGLKNNVTEIQLKNICEEILSDICKAEDGWVKIVKNGENAYYHPKHIRALNFDAFACIKQDSFDPIGVVLTVIRKIRENHKEIFIKNVEFIPQLVIFGKGFYDGNFTSNCCFNHKVKF